MRIKKVKYSISGMTCNGCAGTIEKALSGTEGILKKSVSFARGLGEFEIDEEIITKEKVEEIINSTHYKVVEEIKSGEKNLLEKKSKEATTENNYGDFNYDLIIIGGGSAAFAAAIKASSLLKTVLMINDGLPIGGSCVNVGCVPSKTLIRNAEQFYYSNNPNFSGIIPGNNRLNFRESIRQKTELVSKLRKEKYVNVLKDDSNVTIIKGRAELLKNRTVAVNGKIFTSKKILISTGSSTFIPDIPGLKNVNYLTNVSLYDLEEIPEHLIIIGGRYIALENAQLFARLGAKVTILQRSNRIIPDETEDVSDELLKYLTAENIEIKTGVKIKSIEGKNGKIFVSAIIKGKAESVEGSHIFVATGRTGNSGNFGKIGIEIFGNGFVKTNKFLQTTIPNIYAAGDITGEYLFVYSAAYEGALAVENMFGNKKNSKDYSVFPWVIFTDPQIAGVGMNEKQAAENNIEFDVSTIFLKDIPRSLAARNKKGFIKLLRDRNSDKLIGARIVASEGSELLMEISLAIKYGITAEELKNMFHPYLTLSEGVKLAAIGFDTDVHKLSCCAV